MLVVLQHIVWFISQYTTSAGSDMSGWIQYSPESALGSSIERSRHDLGRLRLLPTGVAVGNSVSWSVEVGVIVTDAGSSTSLVASCRGSVVRGAELAVVEVATGRTAVAVGASSVGTEVAAVDPSS